MKHQISKIFLFGLIICSFLSPETLKAQFPGAPTPPPPPSSPNLPPQLPPPPGWGSPGFLTTPNTQEWVNNGNLNVMATGYDSQGVLQQIPLYVSYAFNGVNYNVSVLNSWNPYTQNWVAGIDQPAYQTNYYLNGFKYNYYVVLPTGTFYFNL